MAVELHTIAQADFEQFIKHSIPYYAQEMIDIGEYSQYAMAYHQSYYETLSCFDGSEVPESEIIETIYDPERKRSVGQFWVSVKERETGPVVFITYVWIDPAERSNGYAEEAMRLSEQRWVDVGYRLFELYVLVNNLSAIKLYERLGYRIQEKKAQGQSRGISRFMMQKTI